MQGLHIIVFKKFSQNQVSNSGNIPDMDKNVPWKNVAPNLLLNFGENMSVTAEILLIWTNVARTNFT